MPLLSTWFSLSDCIASNGAMMPLKTAPLHEPLSWALGGGAGHARNFVKVGGLSSNFVVFVENGVVPHQMLCFQVSGDSRQNPPFSSKHPLFGRCAPPGVGGLTRGPLVPRTQRRGGATYLKKIVGGGGWVFNATACRSRC